MLMPAIIFRPPAALQKVRQFEQYLPQPAAPYRASLAADHHPACVYSNLAQGLI